MRRRKAGGGIGAIIFLIIAIGYITDSPMALFAIFVMGGFLALFAFLKLIIN